MLKENKTQKDKQKTSNCQARILYLGEVSSKNREIKVFLDKPKLRKFITMRPALQEMVKGLLQAEMKGL